MIPSVQSDNKESGIVHILKPLIEAANIESLRFHDHIVNDYPGLIIETGRMETSVNYQLHELVPLAIGLCRKCWSQIIVVRKKRVLGVQC